MIEIKQTASDLLLYIPASQKERAKAIEGRRWDPDRRCWAYPRTRRVYDALIAEFGDDLVPAAVPSPPQALAGPAGRLPVSEELVTENQGLREELTKIRETLEQFGTATSNGHAGDVPRLEARLAARESEMLELDRRLREREADLEQARRDVDSARVQLVQLQQVNDALQADATRGRPDADARKQFTQTLKELAKYTAGGEPSFVRLLNRLKLSDESLPVTLGKELENELRRCLNTTDRSLSLHDLITQARDSEVLTPEAVDLAHIIRKQRNITAHAGTAEQRTFQARRLLSLYAAALLWPELVGGEEARV